MTRGKVLSKSEDIARLASLKKDGWRLFLGRNFYAQHSGEDGESHGKENPDYSCMAECTS